MCNCFGKKLPSECSAKTMERFNDKIKSFHPFVKAKDEVKKCNKKLNFRLYYFNIFKSMLLRLIYIIDNIMHNLKYYTMYVL